MVANEHGQTQRCPRCKGAGKIWQSNDQDDDLTSSAQLQHVGRSAAYGRWRRCPRCNGTGKVWESKPKLTSAEQLGRLRYGVEQGALETRGSAKGATSRIPELVDKLMMNADKAENHRLAVVKALPDLKKAKPHNEALGDHLRAGQAAGYELDGLLSQTSLDLALTDRAPA